MQVRRTFYGSNVGTNHEVDAPNAHMVMGRMELAGRQDGIFGGEVLGGMLAYLVGANVERKIAGGEMGTKNSVQNDRTLVCEIVIQPLGSHHVRPLPHHDVTFEISAIDGQVTKAGGKQLLVFPAPAPLSALAAICVAPARFGAAAQTGLIRVSSGGNFRRGGKENDHRVGCQFKKIILLRGPSTQKDTAGCGQGLTSVRQVREREIALDPNVQKGTRLGRSFAR